MTLEKLKEKYEATSKEWSKIYKEFIETRTERDTLYLIEKSLKELRWNKLVELRRSEGRRISEDISMEIDDGINYINAKYETVHKAYFSLKEQEEKISKKLTRMEKQMEKLEAQ